MAQEFLALPAAIFEAGAAGTLEDHLPGERSAGHGLQMLSTVLRDVGTDATEVAEARDIQASLEKLETAVRAMRDRIEAWPDRWTLDKVGSDSVVRCTSVLDGWLGTLTGEGNELGWLWNVRTFVEGLEEDARASQMASRSPVGPFMLAAAAVARNAFADRAACKQVVRDFCLHHVEQLHGIGSEDLKRIQNVPRAIDQAARDFLRDLRSDQPSFRAQQFERDIILVYLDRFPALGDCLFASPRAAGLARATLLRLGVQHGFQREHLERHRRVLPLAVERELDKRVGIDTERRLAAERLRDKKVWSDRRVLDELKRWLAKRRREVSAQ